MSDLFRIEAPHFVAGFEANGAVERAAPIIRYMTGWRVSRVYQYCDQKGWFIERIKENDTSS